MENLIICLNAVLPIFITIAVGYASCRLGIISRENVPHMNKVAFTIFFPVLSFNNVYRSDLSTSIHPELAVFTVLAILTIFSLSWLIVSKTEKTVNRRGVLIQALFRTNYAILSIPLAQSLLGKDSDIGTIALLSAIVVPMYNALAVLILSFYNGSKPNPRAIIRGIVTNPLVIGSVAGIIASVTKLKLPTALDTVVSNFSAVTTPLMLFLLGAFFRFDGLRKNAKALTWICLFRLIIIPGVMMSIAMLLGFRGIDFVAVLCLFASPVAVASFTMAQQMNGDAELAGGCAVFTSLFCSLTLFLWSLLFKSMGIF